MDKTRLADIKHDLEKERDRLRAELDDFEASERQNLSESSGENNYRDHMADQGTATFAREMDATLADNARRMLEQVEKALQRMESGDWGSCVRCGDVIGSERLEAMPAADLCIACKEWEESR